MYSEMGELERERERVHVLSDHAEKEAGDVAKRDDALDMTRSRVHAYDSAHALSDKREGA